LSIGIFIGLALGASSARAPLFGAGLFAFGPTWRIPLGAPESRRAAAQANLARLSADARARIAAALDRPSFVSAVKIARAELGATLRDSVDVVRLIDASIGPRFTKPRALWSGLSDERRSRARANLSRLPDDARARVEAALGRGAKAEAAGVVRAELGAGPPDSRDVVKLIGERRRRAAAEAVLARLSEDARARMESAVRYGDKIQAIRIVRREVGTSLQDAVDVVNLIGARPEN
jgi:hypothetical protein